MKEQLLLNQLLAYQDGKIPRSFLEKTANELLLVVAEDMKNDLRINDIFLYQLLTRLTTLPEQAYQSKEIDELIHALRGDIFISYHCFYRISENMLTDYEKQIQVIANDFLERMKSNPAATIPEQWLSDSNFTIWCSLQRTHSGIREEFSEITTVPEWIACQIEKLLWIGMSDRKIARLNLDRNELAQKIEHYYFVLSGKKIAFLVIGKNTVSVI